MKKALITGSTHIARLAAIMACVFMLAALPMGCKPGTDVKKELKAAGKRVEGAAGDTGKALKRGGKKLKDATDK